MADLAIYNFENDATDSSGNGYTLTSVGTPVYVTSPATIPQGTYCTGKFSDANYFTGPAGLRTAFSSLTAYTIQMWVYLDTDNTNPVLYRWVEGAESYLEILNTGAVFWVASGDPNLSSAAGAVPEDTWTHIAFTWDGSSRRIYVNNALVASTTSGNNTGTVTAIQIGRYGSAGFYIDGYMDQLRISNTALTSFPSIDTFTFSVNSTTDTTATLTWTDSPIQGAYLFYYNTTNTISGATIGGYAVQGTQTLTVRGLTAGTTYYFFAKVFSNTGATMFTSSTGTSGATSSVAAPTSLATGTPTEEAIPLTWTDAASPATRTLIYRHTANVSGSAVLVGAVDNGTQAFTAGGLAQSTQYYFWAKSLTAAGSLSAFTSSVNATTATPAAGADTPTSLTATVTGRDSIRLTWVDGAGTAALLVLRHTSDSYGGASVISGVDAGVQAFSDSGLASGTQYYYWLLPLGTLGPGTETSSANATTYGAAGNPGDDIVSQIVTAARTRCASVLSSDFKQLKSTIDLKKNEKVPWGYGVGIGNEEPSEASVFGSYTSDMALQVILYRHPMAAQNDRDIEAALLVLKQWQDRIHRDFTTTKLYETDVIVRLGDPTVETEYLEDNEAVALRITFPVIYRNSRI